MIFKSFDGKELFVHEWLNVENPKGFVQIVHGMTEHGARYAEFAKFLNANGYLAVADDHRGHGRTDSGSLGYCEGDMFADTVRDEAEITAYYRKKYPGLKYVIFGFSYGSFLTQSYIGKYGDRVDAAIIGGSSYKKDFEVYFGSFLAFFRNGKAPAVLIDRLSFGVYARKFSDRQWLSADAENNASYAADPLSGFTCTWHFYRDFFRGLRSLYTKEYIRGLNQDLPVLLISGGEDPVGNMGRGVKKLRRFYTGKAGMKHVSLVLFENSRHEFLNEKQDRKKKWGTVMKFLEKNCC